ncbi:MAG: aminotransferase class I/II-fold pyridoxal phosphate-dependent enzyme [Bacteroidetes bacterium]|jgi:cystathionine beta-lyase|nr:aminotransferase class I/II-fold pyridoxal phosphate-dependent enzyme [Bacteroidota bacterium]MDF1865362.1 aminotransferase class I/II-fold pyridoxal phosphate-dependent enzyme [Saprospiraceae bacterium]
MNISEILTHLGEDRKKYFNAVSPPIIQTSNFVFNSLSDFRQAMTDELAHNIYTRGNNPTVEILRKKLAALEGSEDALVFAAGAGAISAAIIGNVKSGDHIICVDKPYSWTFSLLTKFLPRFNVSHTFVDGRDINKIKKAIQPNTTFLMLESPNSISFEIQDLKACAELAKRHGIISCIDNSYASPYFQNPINFGIDIVVHSGSKYINGHSDVVCGVLCASHQMVSKIFNSEQMTLASIISPNEASLILRGLRTFEIRMQKTHESAMKIAKWLDGHPKVKRVAYPFLESFPQHELAKKQMRGCGGLFSVYFKTDQPEKMELFFNRIQRFLLAVSWGGYESLMIPFIAFHNMEDREAVQVPWNLVRIYIGLEDANWLMEDLEQAMEIL